MRSFHHYNNSVKQVVSTPPPTSILKMEKRRLDGVKTLVTFICSFIHGNDMYRASTTGLSQSGPPAKLWQSWGPPFTFLWSKGQGPSGWVKAKRRPRAPTVTAWRSVPAGERGCRQSSGEGEGPAGAREVGAAAPSQGGHGPCHGTALPAGPQGQPDEGAGGRAGHGETPPHLTHPGCPHGC